MKIEMLEQAFASYLKNYVNCTITQTNWTVSSSMMDFAEKNEVSIENELSEILSVTVLKDKIIKKNKILQFIRQCEIDVVGFKFDNNEKTLYLYDTAFHENGLNYNANTVPNVLKKLIRAFLVADVFFKDFDVYIGFISPKCSEDNQKKINNELANLLPVFAKLNPKIKVDTYLNDSCSDIIEALIAKADDIHDNNDLFIRSIKLYNLSKEVKEAAIKNTAKHKKGSTPTPIPSMTPIVNLTMAKESNKNKIYNIIDYLVDNGYMTPKLVDNLTDLKYTLNNFGISSYSILKDVSLIKPDEERRYYPKILTLYGKLYKICNHWVPESKPKLQDWFDNKKYL